MQDLELQKHSSIYGFEENMVLVFQNDYLGSKQKKEYEERAAFKQQDSIILVVSFLVTVNYNGYVAVLDNICRIIIVIQFNVL